MITWTQRLLEKWLFKVELEDWLGDATISATSVTSTPSGLTLNNVTIGTDINILVSAGAVGTTYEVGVTVTASDSRKRTFWGKVTVEANVAGAS